ncbi:MAG: glycosyltransferase family 4 protein [Clostridium sp.]
MKIYVDITNLMEVNFLTGIQRVVREVLVRLVKYENMEIILLRYSPLEEEFKKLDNENFYKYFKENNGEKSEIETEETINIASMDSGSVFLEIDSIWNASYRCSEFLPLLKDKGIKIVAYIYDIIPVTHPQFFHTNTLYNFLDYFGANIQYADALIVSTQSVLDTIYRVTDKLGIQRIPGYVSWLGSDFQVRPSEAVVSLAVANFLEKRKKYVLIVGTIEPRKNHKILLDAFDEKLFSKDVCLVIVGKIGWNVDELEKRIRNHPQLNKRLFFFEGLNDASVSALYQDAFFVAFPTYDEGFGLPMIEAFERKVPVIASDCPVMREVGESWLFILKQNLRIHLKLFLKNIWMIRMNIIN